MVVSPRTEKCCGIADPLHDLETEHSCIESYRPLKVGDLEVHMAHNGVRIDRGLPLCQRT